MPQEIDGSLKQFAVIARFNHAETCDYLLGIFDSVADRYTSGTLGIEDMKIHEGTPRGLPPPLRFSSKREGSTATPSRLMWRAQSLSLSLSFARSILGQLTWLVFVIGSVIGGRSQGILADGSDELDGQLICRCFQLSNFLTDLGPYSERLDMALLSFYRHFRLCVSPWGDECSRSPPLGSPLLCHSVTALGDRAALAHTGFPPALRRRTHVGEQLPPSSKVAECLAMHLNLNSESEVLNALVQKILSNLRNWIERCVPRPLCLAAYVDPLAQDAES